MTSNTSIKTVDFRIEDGILRSSFNTDQLNLSQAKEIVAYRKEVTAGQIFPVLIDNMSVKRIAKNTRDFLSSTEAVEGISATAIITDNTFKRSLVNFFLLIASPPFPTRMFTNEADALIWLNEYR